MRDRISRAKRKDNNEWIFGNAIQKSGRWFIAESDVIQIPMEYEVPSCSSENAGIFCAIDYVREIIPETLGDFICLCDKNGKQIFEGDVLQAHLDELYPENETTMVVYWDETAATYRMRDVEASPESQVWSIDFNNWDSSEWEVIANIHDHKSYICKED